MKKIFTILLLALTGMLMAQTPQFYNFTTVGTANSFPFNMAAGKMVQWLIKPGEYNQPTPSTAGNITKFYFFVAPTYPLNSTYTQFYIKMGRSALTNLPAGQFYNGPMDTVFYRASGYNINAPASTWWEFTLDEPFAYYPDSSLIIEIGQCSSTQGTGFSVNQNTTVTQQRLYSVGGCPFVYSGAQGNRTINSGITVASSQPIPRYYFTQWCPAATYPVIPSMSCYGAAAVLGDTLYMAIGTADASTVSNLVYKYPINGGTWSPIANLPTARAQGTLTPCNGKLYFIGGNTVVNQNGTNNVYEYSPTTGQWTSKAPMPNTKSGHSAVVWGDSVIFVVCGNWAAQNTECFAYRPALDSWITSTPFSGGPNRRSQSGGIVGNKIIIAGGYPFTNTVVIGTIGSTAATITWAAGPTYPSVPKSRVGGVGIGDRFYLIGGNNSAGPVSSDSTFIYLSGNNTWYPLTGTVKPDAAHNHNASTVAWVKNDTVRIAALGGSNLTANGTNNFHVIGCGPIVVGTPTVNINIPEVYSLSQNYPNPFNPATKISFAIPKAGQVKLTVYDVLGREVAVIVNEFRQAGNHTVVFDGDNLSSGIYFYSFESGDFKDTKKMTLIK